MKGLVVRPEQAADEAAVAILLEAAFGGPGEAVLVGRLRAAGDIALALVAERDGQLLGHIAFQTLGLRGDSSGALPFVASLAPLAVSPPAQRQGVGSALVRAGIDVLNERGCDVLVVLGATEYYGRFAFRADLAVPFRAPWSSPHFQALRLSARHAAAAGELIYPPAFAEAPG